MRTVAILCSLEGSLIGKSGVASLDHDCVTDSVQYRPIRLRTACRSYGHKYGAFSYTKYV